MLLTITTTHSPATDLGYLLHKNPARMQTFDLAFGKAHVFYPEAEPERCTAALLLDVDPIGLVRGRGRAGEGGLLDQYVNDRPYAASSLLSVAISDVFGTAMAGRSKERPELALAEIPLRASVGPLASRGGGEALIRALFEPLGYRVDTVRHELDARFPEWGASSYFDVVLERCCRVSELLDQLYVLIPVLDGDKHYWIGRDELEKLLARGEGWLAQHPEKETIARRYLRNQARLTREALARLAEGDEPDPEAAEEERAAGEHALERPLRLNDVRMQEVLRVLVDSGAKSVLDLGCGEGRLLRSLLGVRQFERIAGVDASVRALEVAAQRLRLDEMAPRQRARIELWHGALTYRDRRLAGFDAAAAVEVIEHVDLDRLGALERVLFEFARPATVVITTPNREWNVRFADLAAGRLRHPDHRFEWTRAEFKEWAERVAAQHGYRVQFAAVGEEDSALGAASQMGVFARCS